MRGRHDALIARESIAALQAAHFPHQAMHKTGNPGAITKTQQRGSSNKGRQLHASVAAHQIQHKFIGFADGLPAGKGQNGKIGIAVKLHGKPAGIGKKLHDAAPCGNL